MASINGMTNALPAAQQQQQLPSMALASPYDGTTPSTLGTNTLNGSLTGGTVPQLTGLAGTSPQLNATNQTAFAPNGDVNQVVTNDNQYTNKYYNIIVPNSGGLFGGIGGAFGGASGLFSSWNQPGNSFLDPATGVLYVQKDTGITGWFKRLFRGY